MNHKDIVEVYREIVQSRRMIQKSSVEMGIDGTLSFSRPFVPVDLFYIGDRTSQLVSAIS